MSTVIVGEGGEAATGDSLAKDVGAIEANLENLGEKLEETTEETQEQIEAVEQKIESVEAKLEWNESEKTAIYSRQSQQESEISELKASVGMILEILKEEAETETEAESVEDLENSTVIENDLTPITEVTPEPITTATTKRNPLSYLIFGR